MSQRCGTVVSEAVKALSCLVKREASRSTTVRRRSTEDKAMHAGIRTYSGEGAKELVDRLEKRKSEVESLIRSVKGFVSYSLVRTSDGGISVTACQDNASAKESLEKAKEWIGTNASVIGASAPRVRADALSRRG
jgi:hypothetical protein